MPTFSADSVFAKILGPVVNFSSTASINSTYSKYVSDFKTYQAQHWATDGANWDVSNYYDRAKIYYAWWAATGDATYLDRANAIAVNYRTNFLEASGYGTSAHWAQMSGVALHYAVTGDKADLKAIGAVADLFALPYYMNGLSRTASGTEMDNRQQARVLESFILARELKAPSDAGNNWDTLLKTALNSILASQSTDGAYRFQNTQQLGYNKPFMVGQLNDQLINYYNTVEKDPRIIDAVKKSIDYMWANNWDPATKSFYYLEGTVSGAGGREPSPDLNGLIVNGFGWLYSVTGDAKYLARGNEVFAGGVNGSWLNGSKQFNQEYTSSYKFLSYANPTIDDVWTGTGTGGNTGGGTGGGTGGDPGTIFGTDGADNLTGTNGNDVIDARGGNDIVVGGSGPGNDTYIGGAGTDTLVYTSGLGKVVINLSTGKVDGGPEIGHDTISGFENATAGRAGDLLIGNAQANRLDGYTGNDTLVGGAGADTLIGGEGRDTADYSASGFGVTVNLSLTTAQTSAGDASGDVLNSVENVIGSAFADRLTGNAEANVLSGGAGNDTLIGGAGADTLNGGEGTDTASYETSASAVQVNLGRTSAQSSTGDAAGDVLSSIENVTGSSKGDYLVGNLKANLISGGDGNDALSGAAGNDTLLGGNGNDVLRGGSGNDLLNGGNGSDDLRGGLDADTFVFRATESSGTNTDTIRDLNFGDGDTLFFSDFLAGTFKGIAGGNVLDVNAAGTSVTINSIDDIVELAGASSAVSTARSGSGSLIMTITESNGDIQKVLLLNQYQAFIDHGGHLG